MTTKTLKNISIILSFPSNSNGLSNYKPSIYSDEVLEQASTRSPPRKTARLEGDRDNTSSRSRNKGKQREQDSPASGSTIPVFSVESSGGWYVA